MLQKNLKLVGLAVTLVLLGSSLSIGAAVQQDATLDPGAVDTDGESQQILVAEALAEMIEQGYRLTDFDIGKAVADPDGKVLFVPVKHMPQSLEELPALVGLLYVRETVNLDGQILQRGLYPVIHTNRVDSTEESPQSKAGELGDLRRPIPLHEAGCYNYVTFNSDFPYVHFGRTCIIPDAPPPPQPPQPSPQPPYNNVNTTLAALLCAEGDQLACEVIGR